MVLFQDTSSQSIPEEIVSMEVREGGGEGTIGGSVLSGEIDESIIRSGSLGGVQHNGADVRDSHDSILLGVVLCCPLSERSATASVGSWAGHLDISHQV
jgi:hypothetical protein